MTARRLRPLVLLAGGLLAPALLAGCGIRPTAVPVDAGAPASRTACPSELLAPRAPESAAPSAADTGKAPAASPSPTTSASTSTSASPSPSADGVFVAPSPDPQHCA
ncbi:hypothetical protein ACFC6L_28860 [Kitasatospora phosalacinea]|uniref:hypothetical protein n=1 Tax=Kitasatospora phosalacinea TaxID=2065 RepID=UPI0035DC07F5